MDEELRKRNTDCVYFLASPLTCKKGIECEFRHSDIARLNPRECWYWSSGSCLNPSCAFRHPPLDMHAEASSESAHTQHQGSAPVNKVNTPCYFYFNGFCSKGDRCSFLHVSDEDGTVAWKSSKTASAVTGANPLENKTSAGSDAGSVPRETHPILSEAASKGAAEIQTKLKEDAHLSARTNVQDQSAASHVSASEGEEAAVVRFGTLPPENGLIQSRSLLCTDQSSDELEDGHIEREDWLESSPGFDVLVDDRSENLGYEDDHPEYLLAVDREGRELNGHFLGYDYEDPVEYDPMYPDAAIFCEQETLDSFDQFDSEQRVDYIRKVPGRSREELLDPIFPRKRKFLPMDLVMDGRRIVDLRDHLKKRRVTDSRSTPHLSRRNNSSFLVDRSRERPQQHRARRLHGRLATEVDNNSIGSLSGNGCLLSGTHSRGRFGHSRSNRPRQHYEEKRHSKRQFISSEVARKPVSRQRISTEESATMFTGPKTLAQIKEEKRKATENDNSSGRLGHSGTSEEFEGPKSLREILKNKKKLDPIVDANNVSF